jgi:hypothetical protein
VNVVNNLCNLTRELSFSIQHQLEPNHPVILLFLYYLINRQTCNIQIILSKNKTGVSNNALYTQLRCVDPDAKEYVP